MSGGAKNLPAAVRVKVVTAEDLEADALTAMTRAIASDISKQYQLSLDLYKEAIKLFRSALLTTNDEIKGKELDLKCRYCMTKGEIVGNKIALNQLLSGDPLANKTHLIHVYENCVGVSYYTVFGPYLEIGEVTWVEIDDNYIRNELQVKFFSEWCDVVIELCPKIKSITLETGTCEEDATAQKVRLDILVNRLRNLNVELAITFSPHAHDREVRLSNGWNIQVGRGLDYFQHNSHQEEQDLRKCKATTVTIFFKPII